MKKIAVLTILILSIALLYGCKGDRGPTGTDGTNGNDGTDSMQSMSFQNGVYPETAYSGETDSYIGDGTYAANNYGIDTVLYVGRYYSSPSTAKERLVYKFTGMNAYLPAGAVIKSAEITIHSSNVVSSGFTGVTMTAYALTHDWTEAGVTWTDFNGTNPWLNGGGDYSAAVTSSYCPVPSTYFTLAIDTATVAAWVSTPATNYGLIFISQDEGTAVNNYAGMRSGNHTTIAERPKLTIYYQLP